MSARGTVDDDAKTSAEGGGLGLQEGETLTRSARPEEERRQRARAAARSQAAAPPTVHARSLSRGELFIRRRTSHARTADKGPTDLA